MLSLYLTLKNLWADKRGVTAIEYAILAGAVALGLAALVNGDVFATLQTQISDAINLADTPDPAP